LHALMERGPGYELQRSSGCRTQACGTPVPL
jgi:hypothetical protein